MEDAPVYKFISSTQIRGPALQHSIVKQNATRICSTYTTALNPVSCIPFSSCLFTFLLEKNHACFWFKCHPLMN